MIIYILFFMSTALSAMESTEEKQQTDIVECVIWDAEKTEQLAGLLQQSALYQLYQWKKEGKELISVKDLLTIEKSSEKILHRHQINLQEIKDQILSCIPVLHKNEQLNQELCSFINYLKKYDFNMILLLLDQRNEYCAVTSTSDGLQTFIHDNGTIKTYRNLDSTYEQIFDAYWINKTQRVGINHTKLVFQTFDHSTLTYVSKLFSFTPDSKDANERITTLAKLVQHPTIAHYAFITAYYTGHRKKVYRLAIGKDQIESCVQIADKPNDKSSPVHIITPHDGNDISIIITPESRYYVSDIQAFITKQNLLQPYWVQPSTLH